MYFREHLFVLKGKKYQPYDQIAKWISYSSIYMHMWSENNLLLHYLQQFLFIW